MSSVPSPHVPPETSYNIAKKPPIPHRPFSDPNHLAPEDAFHTHDYSRRQQRAESFLSLDDELAAARSGLSKDVGVARRRRRKGRGRSGSRFGRSDWKKLLWVDQKEYPDNYTDPKSFLSKLQRNQSIRPYDFWPLVADSTVIVQHISSVAIFVCSFVGIYMEKVSPVSVVSWGSTGTVLGWILWDFWIGQEATSKTVTRPNNERGFINALAANEDDSPNSTRAPTPSNYSGESAGTGLGLSLSTSHVSHHSRSFSQASFSSAPSPIFTHTSSTVNLPSPQFATSRHSSSMHRRLKTAKSAMLICVALLGLSPILKSLTLSTSPDSIWPMTCCLMCLNVLFFDYSGGVDVKYPAALSMNAAVMASTVLASQLRDTTHVFSLTLFSIEIFGLFPIFTRHLRNVSWRGHLILTLVLVLGAGASLGTVLWGQGWKQPFAGATLWSISSILGMGGCSWWLIGLQRYKNVVTGPWDPARPVIRDR
ncbi:glycosylphosphatidylinositol anchor biosynthesis [Lecanora helva]